MILDYEPPKCEKCRSYLIAISDGAKITGWKCLRCDRTQQYSNKVT